MKITLGGINSRLDTVVEKISGVEDTAIETIQWKHREKKVTENSKQGISELRDSVKQTSTHVFGAPKGRKTDRKQKK